MQENETAVIRFTIINAITCKHTIKIYHKITKKLLTEYGEFDTLEETKDFAKSHSIIISEG